MAGRRTSGDKEWQEVKRKVFERDNNSCRLCKVLSIQELMLLKKNAKQWINTIDPAHFIAVSAAPSLCYKSYNICALNHYSHSNLDSFKDPIDGHPITEEEVREWWIRILKGDKFQYSYLLKKQLI